uniref:Uncharacterized protein n=1 Tax=Brassica campestris TaxID=3711 RepID=A0A3P6BP18_BRACM|nr:unnamed protein product [Brassica rapa]
MAGKCTLASVLGLLLVFTLFQNPLTVCGQSIPAVALFTFGDSNFDAGNKQTLTQVNVAQGFWPYGKSRDDPNGKFSDGFIAPDFVATFMEIPIPIPAALKPGVNVSRGASFAVADATLLGAPVQSLTLYQQITKFNEMKAANWNDDFIKQSLFMIYIGANDYLNFTKNNPNADASAQQAFVTSVTNQLKNEISFLYASGARKLMIQTLAPLGCLPIVRQDYRTGMEQCYEPLNNLAIQHNEKIGPMLNEMALNAPDFQFTVFDFYNVILRRITPQRSLGYRFLRTNVSCCGIGTHTAYGCGLPNVHSKLCSYQRSYLFFDGRHNSEKAQESFGHLMFGADPNVIQPMNIRELVTYPVGEPMRTPELTPHREHGQSLLRHGKRSRRGTDSIGSSLIGG